MIHFPRSLLGGSAVVLLCLALVTPPLRSQQLTADQAADMILTSAQKAFNEKNYPFAVQRFREFLSKFGGHKSASTARYGLALAILESPDKNYQEARDLLQALAGNKSLPEHAQILYQLGLAMRGQGLQELAIADAKPQEAPQRRGNAQQRFTEAAGQFAAALAAFTAQAPKEIAADSKELPLAWEWAARARCDLAEMQLRLLKPKEAQATAESFLKDPTLTKSRYRDLGRYHHGFASFLLKDYPAAEKTLTLLAPFTDPVFGTHARYLLARTHHLADERTEAAHHYEATLADHAKNKAQAAELLKQPDKLKTDPAEKARLEALLRDPPPDHVARATFYASVLQYEAGKFGEARGRLQEFIKQHPSSPLRAEAELRVGFCHVQLKDYGEAVKTLSPLVDKDKRLSDQVLFWLGKAQAGLAPEPSTNPAAYQQTLNTALNTLRQAAERAQQQLPADPSAKERRGEILLEIADTQQLLKQGKDAVSVYNQVVNEKLLPQREEEVHQRLVSALHLSGDYNESDKAVARFLEKFPKSTLLPSVLFRHAENSYFRLLSAEKNPNPAERAKELGRLYGETVKRFQVLVDKYAEFPQANLARYSLALTYYRQGELQKARLALDQIPAQDRGGELAVVPYLLADCLMRLAPTAAPEDALETAKLEEQLKKAAELLESYIAAQPNSPQVPDALLKLGLCQQRLAQLVGAGPERVKAFAAARTTYERLLAPAFAKSPLQRQAVLERAKCIAQSGDLNGAINELRRFTADPLKNSSIAPMALLQLAASLRSQNKVAEAADILAKGREQHEAALSKDPARADWVVLLRYHHGLALREAGKLPEARAVFDQVVKQSGTRPEAAEAALRFGQCLKEEGQQKIDASRKIVGAAKKPEEVAAAHKLAEHGYQLVRDAVGFFEKQAEQLKKQQPEREVRARLLYEAAWCYRTLSGPELDNARSQMVKELQKKQEAGIAKLPSEISLSKVPLQAAEKKTRDTYQAIIDAFSDLPLATDARFELAELLAERNEHDQALQLLSDGLDREPPPELTDKIRLRLGGIHAAKGNPKGALAQFDAVAANPKSPLAAQAHYRAGEILLLTEQPAEAVKRLSLFRDQPPLQNIPGVSDRALLRLGQAFANLKSWDQSRQAHETLVGRFPNSPWVDDARYGMGWAWQQQKQYDQAVNVYSQVTNRTATETAAKSQLQIGLIRIEQKRFPEASTALLVVPFTYDYPELSAVALLEAARAFSELKQNEQAVRLLERVIRDHPNSRSAEAARDRLDALREGAKKAATAGASQ
jgi:TolA-binding protein